MRVSESLKSREELKQDMRRWIQENAIGRPPKSTQGYGDILLASCGLLAAVSMLLLVAGAIISAAWTIGLLGWFGLGAWTATRAIQSGMFDFGGGDPGFIPAHRLSIFGKAWWWFIISAVGPLGAFGWAVHHVAENSKRSPHSSR